LILFGLGKLMEFLCLSSYSRVSYNTESDASLSSIHLVVLEDELTFPLVHNVLFKSKGSIVRISQFPVIKTPICD